MRKWKVVLFAVVVGGAFTYASAWPVTQAWTPGFYKNHPQFITGTATCLSGLNENTLVSDVFTAVDASSCVGKMSLLQLLHSDTSACGAGGGNTIEGAEIILWRQAITRMLNATNSAGACWAAKNAISATDTAIATDNLNSIKNQASIFNNLNNDKPCTLGD